MVVRGGGGRAFQGREGAGPHGLSGPFPEGTEQLTRQAHGLCQEVTGLCPEHMWLSHPQATWRPPAARCPLAPIFLVGAGEGLPPEL